VVRLSLPLVLLAIALPAVSTKSSEPAASLLVPDDPQTLSRQVRGIFIAKCTECHGAAVERPRGHFGYVTDLARIAANPQMLRPGDPAHSELYLMVKYDEMPVLEATSPPLTSAEKNIVKRWIEAGAPAVAVDAPPPAPPLTWWARIIRDLGQFHPLAVHFPIALLIAALPAEILSKRTRNPAWKSIVRYCVAVGAVTAVGAAALGWCLAASAAHTGRASQVLEWHRWVGTATAVWAVVVLVLSERTDRVAGNDRAEAWFRGALVAGILLLTTAGYLGASIIDGLNHFQW